jgi:hypothetical protein
VRTPFEVTLQWCRANGIGPNDPPGAGLTGKNIIEVDGKVWDGRAWWSLGAPDHASNGGYEATRPGSPGFVGDLKGPAYGQSVSRSVYPRPSVSVYALPTRHRV